MTLKIRQLEDQCTCAQRPSAGNANVQKHVLDVCSFSQLDSKYTRQSERNRSKTNL